MGKIITWVATISALLLSAIAIMGAGSYETVRKNMLTYSFMVNWIPGWVTSVLSSRWTLFVLTAVVFTYAGGHLALWMRRKDRDAAYAEGFSAGEAKAVEERPAAKILDSIIEQAQPKGLKQPIYPPSIDQLTYAIREIVTALSKPGILDDEAVGRNMGKIKQEGRVWHIATNYNLRKSFIDVVEKARAARQNVGNSVYNISGDYSANVRDHHITSLSNCSDRLIDHLHNQTSRLKASTVV